MLSDLTGWQGGVVRAPGSACVPLQAPTSCRSGRGSGLLEQGGGQPPMDTQTTLHLPALLGSPFSWLPGTVGASAREDPLHTGTYTHRTQGLWGCDSNNGVVVVGHPLPIPPRALASPADTWAVSKDRNNITALSHPWQAASQTLRLPTAEKDTAPHARCLCPSFLTPLPFCWLHL